MIDYCKHGVYVGGCGIDWMCHACEMGDVEPTPVEAEAHMFAAYERMLNGRTEMVQMIHEGIARVGAEGADTTMLKTIMGEALGWKSLLTGFGERRSSFVSAVATWQQATEWAEGPDDNDWLARRHRVLCEEEEARREGWSTADHIAALPLHVQEGSY